MIKALIGARVCYVLISFVSHGMGRRKARVSIPDDDQFSNNNSSKRMNLLYRMLRFLLGASKPSLTDDRVCYMLM